MKIFKNRKKIRFKVIIYLLIFILNISLTFYYLSNENFNIDNELLVKYLLNSSNGSINNSIDIKKIDVIDILNLKYIKPLKMKKVVNTNNTMATNNYLVYLYNTHQSEEYKDDSLVSNSINPTVTINNYIIKDYLKNKNINAIVEERSIKDILNINGLNYAGSYKASRIFLEDIKTKYPTLKYFIDIHRDSLSKDRTTININDKSYASILFIVGLENPNYNANLEFTTKIDNKINEKYPNLSKGILKKSGPGVNGIYNQDFSPYTILIEIGGEENTINEVMNTSLAISEIISEVILENER